MKSFWEAFIDVGSGLLIAYLTQLFIIPFLFNVEFSASQNLGIVFTFFCMSLLRSTLWRKFFKNRYKNKTNKILKETGYCRICKRGD